MTKLDRLESQSLYILREALSRLDKLAMLWSLGKDSNTMVWLARMEFPETYAFRERYVGEWGLNVIAVPCPLIEQSGPSLPPISRLAARKTDGPCGSRPRMCTSSTHGDSWSAGSRAVA